MDNGNKANSAPAHAPGPQSLAQVPSHYGRSQGPSPHAGLSAREKASKGWPLGGRPEGDVGFGSEQKRVKG